MPKKTLRGANLLKKATDNNKGEKIDLNATVLMTMAQIEELKRGKPKKTAHKMVYLTEKEMEVYLNLIGRKTFSNSTRKLILDFISKNNNE